MNKLLAILFILLMGVESYGYEHVRPVPSMPNLKSTISGINDSITYSLVAQVHRGLFKVGNESVPVPDLVGQFQVGDGGFVYELTIKNGLSFHNGASLTASAVVKSLKRSLKDQKGHLAEKFGLGRILNNPNKSRETRWASIQKDSKGKVRITLSHKNPKLIYFLADPRMSITPGKSVRVGLGPYMVTEVKKDKIELKRVISGDLSYANKVIYKKANLEQAIDLFKKGRAHDLSMYTVSNEQLSSIMGQAQLHKTLFPKTFSFFINARRNNLKQRKSLANWLMSANLTKACELSQSNERAFVPKGYPGHTPMQVPTSVGPLNKKIVVMIPKDVGKEECVKKTLESKKPSGLNAQIKIVDFSHVAGAWAKNKVDVYYGYIEGESDFSFFEHFIPTSTFPLGSPSDLVAGKLFDRLAEVEDVSEKHKVSKKMADHLNKQFYYVPVYSPVVHFAMSKEITLNQGVMQAPYQMSLAHARKLR